KTAASRACGGLLSCDFPQACATIYRCVKKVFHRYCKTLDMAFNKRTPRTIPNLFACQKSVSKKKKFFQKNSKYS
ncbi:MAG: hypothetical protein J6S76_01860, partial [Clostridia bacterium]|nr:hypothetical protein [Clostridia bacterium]